MNVEFPFSSGQSRNSFRLKRRDWLRLCAAGVAGSSMSGWFGALADEAARAHARHVRRVPAEMMCEWRKKHRRIGQPATDDNVRRCFQRRKNRIGADIGVHADDRHADIGE